MVAIIEVAHALSTISLNPTVLPNGYRKFDIQLNDKDANAIPYAGVPIVAKVGAYA